MHAHTEPSDNERRLTIVVAMTAVYMLAEVVGGLVTGSLALLADSGHLLGDVLGLAMALGAIRFARRPATAGKTYGFYRAEILAALINSVALIVVAFWILFAAWQRLMADTSVDAAPMLAIALGGVVVTLLGALLLHQGAASSLNVRAAFLEVSSDLLGSVGTVIAALIILATGWMPADALISAMIGILMLPRALALMRSVVDVLLESTPRHLDMPAIETAMLAQPGVESVHDVHLWSITSGFDAMSGHVRSNGRASEDVLHDLRTMLRDQFHIQHVTLQVEAADHADDGACCVADPRCFVPSGVPRTFMQ